MPAGAWYTEGSERMTTMRFDTIIYDLDGTLLHTLPDLAAACNYVLETLGFPTHEEKAVASFIGGGADQLVRLALPEETSQEIFEKALALYKDYCARHLSRLTAPFDGILSLLQAADQAGVRQAVVSNKGDENVKNLCRIHFGTLIGHAAGARPDVRPKPHPDSLLKVMEELGCDPARVLYVGDSDTDVLTARRAGVACAAVCWGYRPESCLASAQPDWLIHSPGELLSLIQKTTLG